MDLGNDHFVTFTINGTVYHVSNVNVTAEMSLNKFIREEAKLSGTKYMCEEGGCGCCVVTVQSTHPATGADRIYAVNSCLVPILACHGFAITTVEGIGDKLNGYHPIQKNLAHLNGSQCGFCSPGFVMNMYSLKKSRDVSMIEVDNSFAGNICRCTGYRPILDAFKALAKDASDELKDIEDLFIKCNNCCKTCTQKTCQDEVVEDIHFVELSLAPKNLKLKLKNKTWYRVKTVPEIFEIFDIIGDASYMLLAGNTAQGVFPVAMEEQPDVYIDINDVPELHSHSLLNQRLDLGANMSLSETIAVFSSISKQSPLMFGYLQNLADHMDLVANIPVRNIGTLAGNLMIKHKHNEFQSDMFLILELSRAIITIRKISGVEKQVSLPEFLNMNLHKKVITSISLPGLNSSHYILKSYKIMPRRQNTQAMVNAGFLFRIKNTSYTVEEPPRIVYGAITPQFIHANQTEQFLNGKQIYHPAVLHRAIQILESELNPVPKPPEAGPLYKKKLAIGLFYKFVLSINPSLVQSAFKTGGSILERPLSSGKQSFDTQPEHYPVSRPVPKIEAMVQTSGEAVYVNDIPIIHGELHASLVIAEIACTTIKSIDPSPALKMEGVVAFYSAKDIPGTNSFITYSPLTPEDEEIFSSGKITHYGQSVGMIVAETRDIALEAAKRVQIIYTDKRKPLLTIKEVLQSGDPSRKIPMGQIAATKPPGSFEHRITGEVVTEGQYHFTLELQVCLCVPKEDGFKLYSATQWIHNIQNTISHALNIPANCIDVEVRRLGGSYGSKISKSALLANACALASFKLNKPVRMVLDLETQIKLTGKRYPCLAQYDVVSPLNPSLLKEGDISFLGSGGELLRAHHMSPLNHSLPKEGDILFLGVELGVDKDGVIQYLKMESYHDYGVSLNETMIPYVLHGVKGMYDFSTWNVDVFAIITDHVSSAFTRAPGSVEGVTVIESIMERIAHVVGKDRVSVRMANLASFHFQTAQEMLQTIKTSSDYDNRDKLTDTFNTQNRWKKRGISLVPMKFGLEFYSGFTCFVSIYAIDGTVLVSHGGIEMGQGINTKVAQTVAYAFGIELDMVKIKPSLNVITPNNTLAGGSINTDVICYATLKCCKELSKRLEPAREKLENPTWQDIVRTAMEMTINLTHSYMFSNEDAAANNYFIYGMAVLEVELDVLTGQYQILRVDILEDAGESLNPFIDIGQVEGAFMMGIGYFSSEELKYNPEDGKILTDRTWTYWVPGAKDIPIDFRVTLRKNSKNPKGVLGSKATGEPPLALSCSLMFALRQAISSAREDAGMTDEWFKYDQPCTFEKTLLACCNDVEQFTT